MSFAVALRTKRCALALLAITLNGCANQHRQDLPEIDMLIVNGSVYSGNDTLNRNLDIGLCGKVICAIEPTGTHTLVAKQTIDAKGYVVSPGFIDPHTHTFAELSSDDQHFNLNYLYQGVTTVVNGNDGGGPARFREALARINPQGVGTNFAMFAGHGSLRKSVMGIAKRQASPQELAQMEALLEQAMKEGALGLSTGLYYVPGQFADTKEIIALATIASQFGGIYETHIRDESSFNIGFLKAIDEAIEIAQQASIPLHLAHIKALGVDVWGQSYDAIERIEHANKNGIKVTADQYPWLASGTNIHSAVVPKWALADSNDAFLSRLEDPTLIERIRLEITDNIRRRGGADKLLITASQQTEWVGKTLQDLADQWSITPTEATLKMVRVGRHRVASYNMNPKDVENFMVQPWVVTSSDGTNGHPRKYASFPKKFRQYVKDKPLLTTGEFIHRSSGLTADILGIEDRGTLDVGKAADVLIFDPNNFSDEANFEQWDVLSSGVKYIFVNGQSVIENGQFTGRLAGEFVRPARVQRAPKSKGQL